MIPLAYLTLIVLVHCTCEGHTQGDFPPNQVQVQTNYQANQQTSNYPVPVANQGGYTVPSASYQQPAPAVQQLPYSSPQNNYPQQQPPPSPQPQVGGYAPSPVGGYATYSYPQVAYGPPPKPKFLAAPPGMTPACAKYGGTYCEKIDDYPVEQVHYLLHKFGKFIEPFMTSETNEKPPERQPTYGGYDYTPAKPYYPAPTPAYNTYNNSYGGYGAPAPPAPVNTPQYATPIRFEAYPSNTYTYQTPENVQTQPQFQQPGNPTQQHEQPQQQQYQEPNQNYQPQQQYPEPNQNFQPQQPFQEPLQNYPQQQSPQHQQQDSSQNYQPQHTDPSQNYQPQQAQQLYQEPGQNLPHPQVPLHELQQSPNAPGLQQPQQFPEANYSNFQPQQQQPYLDHQYQQSPQPFQYTGALTPPAPPQQQQQQSPNFANVPAAPPVSPSFWWNHQDTISKQPAYPYIKEHRYNSARKRRQATGGESLCGARNRNTAPRAAMNKNGVWMYVVNEVLEESKYRQTVIVEECTDPGKPCSGLCTLPAGYTSSCVQKNTQKRLIALDPSGNSFVQDTFFFPSCCQCRLTGRT